MPLPKLSPGFKREKPVALVDEITGKVRTKEYQAGNWPTHISLPVECEELGRLQARVVEFFNGESVHTEPLHHSLSHTVYPKTHQVDPILDALEKSLKGQQSSPLTTQYERDLEVYHNDTRARFFLCINCSPASNAQLSKLSAAVDACLESFALQTFYKTPRFHLSLAWAASDIFTRHLADLQKLIPDILPSLTLNVVTIGAAGPLVAHTAAPLASTMSPRQASASNMTSSASLDVSESETADDNRRMSHNEIERRRRDNQRERLEELRSVLPNMRDSKASMVATIVRAKEYIQQLQTRVTDLERMLAMSQGGASFAGSPYISASSAGMPMTYPSVGHGNLPPIAPKMPISNAHTTGYSMSMTSPFMAPPQHLSHPPRAHSEDVQEPAALSVPFKRGRHGSTALFSVPEHVPPEEEEQEEPEENQPMPSEEAQQVMRSRKRRDSALLLPTADPNLFLYGHRDSMQNLFAAPLPFIMQQQEQTETELHCAKCARGIENLIMIDCDRCHTWFHIRCIGLDPERIPVHWTCSNCPQALPADV